MLDDDPRRWLTPKQIARASREAKHYRLNPIPIGSVHGELIFEIIRKDDPKRAYEVHITQNDDGSFEGLYCGCPQSMIKGKFCKHLCIFLKWVGCGPLANIEGEIDKT